MGAFFLFENLQEVTIYCNIRANRGVDMRYIFKCDEKDTKKKSVLYYKWADNLYEQGYTYRMDQLMTDLGVSHNWVMLQIYPELNSVRYTKKYIRLKEQELPDKYSTICFKKSDVIRLFKAQATYTRQTKVVDLVEYLNADREEFEGYVKEFYKLHEEENTLITFNEFIASKYSVELPDIEPTQRNMYAHVPVEPINIFDEDYIKIIANHHGYSNQESLYREMIVCGAIKVSFGTKKTLFLQPKQNYKYAYTVPLKEIKKEE